MKIEVEEGAPQYPAAPLKREHSPDEGRPFEDARPCLREDFFFTCVYCLSTESEVGPSSAYGGYEVEHFRPKGLARFRALRNAYRNLLWACDACNRAKGSQWPSEAEDKRGFRFVDPTREALGNYLELRGERVIAVGPNQAAGEYMIDAIRLNSPVHVLRRQRRAELLIKAATLEASVELMAAEAETLRDPVEKAAVAQRAKQLHEHVLAFRKRISRDARPWDAPSECAC